jgi:hypothetical protein
MPPSVLKHDIGKRPLFAIEARSWIRRLAMTTGSTVWSCVPPNKSSFGFFAGRGGQIIEFSAEGVAMLTKQPAKAADLFLLVAFRVIVVGSEYLVHLRLVIWSSTLAESSTPDSLHSPTGH